MLFLIINLMGQSLVGVFRGIYAFGSWPGFTPVEIARAHYHPGTLQFVTPRSVWNCVRRFEFDGSPAADVALGILSLVGYATFAIIFTWIALATFDRAAGRAKRAKSAAIREPSGSRAASSPSAALVST